MTYLCCLCLFTYSGVKHILCCVFCFVFLRLVCPMLPVSLDGQFLIAKREKQYRINIYISNTESTL